jgi:hypothetical protein
VPRWQTQPDLWGPTQNGYVSRISTQERPKVLPWTASWCASQWLRHQHFCTCTISAALAKKDSPVTFPKSITREKMKFQAQELSGAQIFSC